MTKKKRRTKTTVLEPGSQRERELRAQVAELQQENANLEIRLAAADPWKNLDKRSQALLDRLTRTLTELHNLADPLRSSPIEAQMGYKHADSTIDEGKPTRFWRDFENRLHRTINPILNEFEQRLADKWKPPPNPEMVWCRNTSCETPNKRIPRFVGPRKARIELTQCPTCGGRLTPAT